MDDGYAFRSHAIILAQRARGWRPIGLTSPKHYESWQGPHTDQESIGPVCYERTAGVSGSRWPFVGEARTMMALARRARGLVEASRPHVIHAHSPVLNALPAIWVGRRASIPVVYEMRASWEDAAVSMGKYPRRSWKYRFSQFVETWACRRADHVVVICEGLKHELMSRGIAESKLTVVPNGVNLEAFSPRPPEPGLAERWGLAGKRTVGFIGSFFKWEGLELLVEATSLLHQTRGDVALLLVGAGDMANDLKAQVSRLGLEDVVVMPGAVSPARVSELYSLVDVLAYPRYSTRLTELVTPLKPLEAMAMSKAVVASDVGGHRELIRDKETGLLFKAGESASLADSLRQVLDNDDLRRHLEQAGRAWVTRERSWERTTSAYESVYWKLAGRSAMCGSDPTTVEK